jgi:8-oxo-dGTP pyrophosphatase MutT (NUDIX family)
MTQISYGERLGRNGKIRLGCSAVILSEDRDKVLLTRRADNGQLCLPSGGAEPGESAAEACEREVWEETGLKVRAERLVGVYSDPNYLIEYEDGNRVQVVAINFEASILGGEIGLKDETTAINYFPLHEISQMELMLNHKQRILDTLTGQTEAFIR